MSPLKWLIATSFLVVGLFLFPFHVNAPIPANEPEASKPSQQTSDPAPLLYTKPDVLYPGDVLFVESPWMDTIRLWNRTYSLKPSGDKYVLFIPIPIDMKAGTYPLQSKEHQLLGHVQINAKTFPFDSITVSKQMESMKTNTKRIQSDQLKINQARSQSSSTPYFTGKFKLPVEGKLTTPYGYRRIVNNKPDNPHLAIDLANKTGTPIVAAESGKVVLADEMYLNGNIIIIDHGLNLFATYSHLSEIDVKPGEIVHKGQVIGKIGTTGFSTGPHLHYAMLIGNTFVNPNVFFDTVFIP
ncbi:M23 family metallopeptidase [Brevibacillus ginsengisoli]|uniref:M23 family metallopeptidase n=1 Tax=Brevibacillus ginsengisoli TaxID=363854 RepID=UPI003CEEF76D